MKAVRIQYGCFTGFLMVYGYLWWFMSENLWNSELQATNWIWAGSSGIWKCVMVRLIAYFQKKYIWMDHAKREGGESGWLVDFGALREICKSSPWIGWREKWRSTIELFLNPLSFSTHRSQVWRTLVSAFLQSTDRRQRETLDQGLMRDHPTFVASYS